MMQVLARPEPGRPAGPGAACAARDGSCDLYSPGHQIHYRHQGDAVRSPSRSGRERDPGRHPVTLVLEDDTELRWRHHDPVRLRRILELVPGKRVAYPSSTRCAWVPTGSTARPSPTPWQDCRLSERRAGPA